MRLMSFAKTWSPLLDGSKTVTRRLKQVWTDGEMYFPDHDENLDKIWIPSWWNHRKDEPILKPGEIIEGCQWSPRVGARFCCPHCSYVGSKDHGGSVPLEGWDCPDCGLVGVLTPWPPQRGVFARHIETSIVTLGKGDPDEAAREGFPDLSWAEFLVKAFPGVPLESKVARIEFEET